MIEPRRLRALTASIRPAEGRYVLYWMQASHRARFNPALEWAIEEANRLGTAVVVGFGLMDDYPEANERHYAFLLEGLAVTADHLARRGIPLVVRHGRPDEVALALAREARILVCDRGYLRHQRQWRARVAHEAPCPVVEIEGDVVVPVETASDKREYAARTLRPRLHRHLEDFLHDLPETVPRAEAGPGTPASDPEPRDLDPREPDRLLAGLRLDRSAGRVRRLRGGEDEARRRLAEFVDGGLERYGEARSEPAAFRVSFLSPYLHFGQISPVEVLLAARSATGPGSAGRAAFLEELVVRRELAINFVAFEPAYDRYEALPDWARATLAAHAADPRPYLCDPDALVAAETHDPHWNAAMREMRDTGYMHNTLRMYWGKKVLEWSPDPRSAHATLLALNNRYFLDGRDPNSFTNVGWIFGLHDRPWPERPVYGTVRSMTAGGLERKFDMPAYHAAVARLVAAERGAPGPA